MDRTTDRLDITEIKLKTALNTTESINKVVFKAGFVANYTSCFGIVAFVEDNVTMNSIRYFENHVTYFVQNLRK